MQLRNASDHTMWDKASNQTAKPDGVITVPDSEREHYENHPVWREVGAYVAPVVAPAAPVVAPVVTPVPVEAPVVDATTQEVV